MPEAAPAAVVAPVAASPTPSNGASGKETPTPIPPVKPSAPPEELFELTVNGKPEKLTRQQLIARAQKAEAADRRFQEAASEKKRVEEILAAFEEDPEAALVKLGKDPAKLIEEHIARKAREAGMTEEQRQLEQLKRERDELKSRADKTEAEKKQAAQVEMDAKTAGRLEETLLKSAEAYGLDRNPQTLELLCDVALELVEYGISPTPEQICEEVIHRQREHITTRDAKIFSALKSDPAKLAEYLGPDVVEALLRHSLTKVPKPGASTSTRPRPVTKDPSTGKFLSEADFERKMGLRK